MKKESNFVAKNNWRFRWQQGYLVNVVPIISVPELIDCVDTIWERLWLSMDKENVEEESPWFRGHPQAGWPLIPSIYRKQIWSYNAKDAEDIRGEFCRRAMPFIEGCRFYSIGELFHVMRHYGLPTRLLDWTEGLLLALYFALSDPKAKDPCIWMLNPWWLNEIVIGERELYYSHFREEEIASKAAISPYLAEKSLPSYPVAIHPPHHDRRIVAQKSVFTLHGCLVDGFSDLCAKNKNAQLAKLLLSPKKGAIETLKDQLITAGITETTVFPELAGLTREIKREYGMK
jgi:hypothetical protein